MDKIDYIDKTLNDEWKHITNKDDVSVLGWNGTHFIVEMCGGVNEYTYKQFFLHFVNKNNERIWENGEGYDQTKKYVSGWLCILNGMSIFNIASNGEYIETNKEFHSLSSYIKERVEDAQFCIENNIPLPWMEEECLNYIS